MNPLIPSLLAESWERYQERLNQAAQWRQAPRWRTKRGSHLDRVRLRVGNLLIALGQSLKSAAPPAPHLE